MIDSPRISSVWVEIVKLLLVKCGQRLNNYIKNTSLFYFCMFLCLVDLKICDCLNSLSKPWLELSIKLNQYSIRFFWKALVGFNNLWIFLVSKEFNWESMYRIPSLTFKIESLTRCLGGLIFFVVPEDIVIHIFFQFSFWYISQYCIYDPGTIVLRKGFGLQLLFFSQRNPTFEKFIS